MKIHVKIRISNLLEDISRLVFCLVLFRFQLTSDRSHVSVANASICFLYPLDPGLIPALPGVRHGQPLWEGPVFVTNFSHYDYSVFEHKSLYTSLYTNVPYYREKLVWFPPFYVCAYRKYMKRHIVPQIAVDWLENPRVRQKLFGIRDWKGAERRTGSALLSIKRAACPNNCLQQEIKIVLGLPITSANLFDKAIKQREYPVIQMLWLAKVLEYH